MLTKRDGSKVDWVNIPLDECMEGNGLDAYYTLRIYHKLMRELEKKGLVKFYEKLISPLTTIFAKMEFNGLDIDQDELLKLKTAMETKIKHLQDEILKLPGIPEGTNMESSHDQIRILFSLERDRKTKEWNVVEGVGFGLYPFAKTKTGQPTTDEETMTILDDLVTQEFVKRGLNVKS